MLSQKLSPTNGQNETTLLAKPKTPAELARARIAREMPEVRRNVSRMELSMGAKWLFDRITDDNFWDVMGGDGFGSVCTTIKNLSIFYRHKRDSISRALQEAVAAGVLWAEQSRGFIVIHISAFIPPPKQRVQPMARAMARASNAVWAAGMTPMEQLNPNEEFSELPIKPPESALFHVEQSGGNGQFTHPRGIRARKSGTDADLSKSQQNDTISEHPCPEIGHAVPGNRARHARKSGTPCPISGQSVPGNRARMKENDTIRARKSGTSSPEIGRVMPGNRARDARKSGTKSEKSLVKMPQKPPSKMSPNINKQSFGGIEVFEASRVLEASKNPDRKKQIIAENQFLREVQEVCNTKNEMENFGRNWRLAFRENPARIKKCLNEVRVMKREGTIREIPSAVVFAGPKGLWEIFGGGKISRARSDAAVEKRKQKNHETIQKTK